MIRLYAGFDPREAAGFYAFVQSLIETSPGVGVIPISGPSDGTNAFTLARFGIMELCGWSGWAIFADGADQLLKTDITELWNLRDKRYAVQVVKHDYQTKHPRKYVGTEMESENASYPRKNWSSVMLINCGHISHFNHRHAIREALEKNDGAFLHRFSWLDDEEIGSLPVEWNWLCDEYGASTTAKLLHWTAGIPGFYHYHQAPHAEEWRSAVRKVMRGLDP
jgi:hypothetical protein